MVEKIFLENISNHVKDKQVIRSCWHGFTKGKWCLTSFIAIYNEVTDLVDDQMLFTSTLVDMVSHNAVVGRLTKYRLGNWTS